MVRRRNAGGGELSSGLKCLCTPKPIDFTSAKRTVDGAAPFFLYTRQDKQLSILNSAAMPFADNVNQYQASVCQDNTRYFAIITTVLQVYGLGRHH